MARRYHRVSSTDPWCRSRGQPPCLPGPVWRRGAVAL